MSQSLVRRIVSLAKIKSEPTDIEQKSKCAIAGCWIRTAVLTNAIRPGVVSVTPHSTPTVFLVLTWEVGSTLLGPCRMSRASYKEIYCENQDIERGRVDPYFGEGVISENCTHI